MKLLQPNKQGQFFFALLSTAVSIPYVRGSLNTFSFVFISCVFEHHLLCFTLLCFSCKLPEYLHDASIDKNSVYFAKKFHNDFSCFNINLYSINLFHRIAVISQDFHDMTIGKVEPSGISLLREKLLKAQGYKILSVPYTEFKPKDNLIRRVKYLEAEVKNIVKS